MLRAHATSGMLALFACSIALSFGDSPESRAIAFLSREVPAWSRDNACFSCHNNGDGARTLFRAARRGYAVDPSALRDTAAWVNDPARWASNKGDPGGSDQRLANLQFTLTLLDSSAPDSNARRKAIAKLAADQNADGSWLADAHNPAGSPATYGPILATHLARRALILGNGPRDAIAKATRWLENAPASNVPAAAALLLFASEGDAPRLEPRRRLVEYLSLAQNPDGGWGPYPDSPSEPYDTALALLALSKRIPNDSTRKAISRGREFLIARQNSDGSWPATTRPPGGDSYAQQIATSAWALSALLETKKEADSPPTR